MSQLNLLYVLHDMSCLTPVLVPTLCLWAMKERKEQKRLRC